MTTFTNLVTHPLPLLGTLIFVSGAAMMLGDLIAVLL